MPAFSLCSHALPQGAQAPKKNGVSRDSICNFYINGIGAIRTICTFHHLYTSLPISDKKSIRMFM
ncbi:hypothetical protein D3P08_17200 [Paenibacillus nanensis]|uniref:Uncharacterized protein n=1 Tax=Paenibacillus nanensis TaxID=393251 RepID=A0A3A1UY24_9BACL|nr:hypothetical protein D3P08_17200 [Paenibacillus nanensis]